MSETYTVAAIIEREEVVGKESGIGSRKGPFDVTEPRFDIIITHGVEKYKDKCMIGYRKRIEAIKFLLDRGFKDKGEYFLFKKDE